jgi:hypothetical protein
MRSMCTDRLPAWSTRVYERTGEGRSRVLVAVTDARSRGGGATFVVAQGFLSWIEEFEMQRFQWIARILGARVIIVEVPGFGVAGSRLLPRERRALLSGDFGRLAARMLEAALSTIDGADHDGPLSFLGYSMGASVATGMAKVAAVEGRPVENLVLVEPVGLQRWKLRDLVAATRREDRWIADYVAANGVVDGAAAPWNQRRGVRPATKRRLDLVLLGAALRHGGLGLDLGAAVAVRRVVVVRGDRSELSAVGCQPELAALRQRGVAVTELSVPGHHAFWHSLPAVNDMTHRLKNVLDIPT